LKEGVKSTEKSARPVTRRGGMRIWMKDVELGLLFHHATLGASELLTGCFEPVVREGREGREERILELSTTPH
jgi:hypothetical protein